jgi:hypothetical protein
VTALVQSLLRLYHGVYWFFASHITLKLDFKLFYHFLIGFLLFFAFAFDPRILFPGKLGNFRYVVVGDGISVKGGMIKIEVVWKKIDVASSSKLYRALIPYEE